MKADLLFTNLPHQIHGFTRLFVDGQAQFVVSNGFLDGFSDFGFGLKIPVGRDHIIDPLMLAKVIVVREEMGQPFPGFGQILRLHPAPKLIIDGFPKPLAFADCLGVVGTGHDLLDTLFFEQLFKLPMASPGKILRSLVGQNLQWFAKTGNTLLKGLYHGIRRGTSGKAPGDDVAAEIIQENDQVGPQSLPVQDKAGDVALP